MRDVGGSRGVIERRRRYEGSHVDCKVHAGGKCQKQDLPDFEIFRMFINPENSLILVILLLTMTLHEPGGWRGNLGKCSEPKRLSSRGACAAASSTP